MSLVREALRKAEREAAAKRRRDLGLPEAGGVSLQPFRRRSGAPWFWLSGAGALALLGLGLVTGLLWQKGEASPAFRSSSSELAPQHSSTPEAPHPRSDSLSETSEPRSLEGSVTKGSIVRDRLKLTSPGSVAPEVLKPQPSSEQSASLTRAGGDASQPAAASTSESGAAATVPTYLREVVVPTGELLRLGGIAWSESAPLAYLNGRLLARGEQVEGWTVVTIRREEVELARESQRLRLTLR